MRVCQARLMAPLRIELAPKEEEQYDDLDEIVARWVGEHHTRQGGGGSPTRET